MQKTKNQINDILKLLKKLPENELDSIVGELYSKLTNDVNNTDNSVYTLIKEELPICHKCGSVHVVKNGKDAHGHTRYLCRGCGKSFGALSTSVVSRTRKDADTWQEYIKCMLQGLSIAKSAEACGIAIQTAFTWRHKILNALTEHSFSNSYTGLVEMDELFMRISYKGNHTKSKRFSMPRKSFKRGSDNVCTSSNSKACVLCVVQRDKSFSGVIPCRGAINKPLLEQLFENKVSDETIILTDGYRAYNQYFRTTNAEHIVLPTNNHKPTVKGVYHINNVNALHHRFRKFLEKYNGVATKYLHNYLALFLWLENNKYCNKEDILSEELTKSGSYISGYSLTEFAPIPDLAPAA